MRIVNISSLSKTKAFAHTLYQTYGRTVYALSGDLGAGKTTLVQYLCALDGVTDDVVSPSYGIINTYDGINGVVYHLDLYRLDDEEEAIAIGIEDVLFSNVLVMIEWADKFPELLPCSYIKVELEYQRDGERIAKVESMPSS